MIVKSIRQVKNLTGQAVFLRLDLNVPINKGVIKEDYKITMALPTIRFLLRHNCRLIIATHLDKNQTANRLLKN
jgi:phosphoglycerate kinase